MESFERLPKKYPRYSVKGIYRLHLTWRIRKCNKIVWTSEKVFSYVHVDTGKDLFLCPDEKVIFSYVKVKKDWNFPLIILLVSFPFQYGNGICCVPGPDSNSTILCGSSIFFGLKLYPFPYYYLSKAIKLESNRTL